MSRSLDTSSADAGRSVTGVKARRFLVLSPCGVCRERLAVYGPDVLVGVAAPEDPAQVVWKALREVLPDYWMAVFPGESTGGW